jgi:hypothetical protein
MIRVGLAGRCAVAMEAQILPRGEPAPIRAICPRRGRVIGVLRSEARWDGMILRVTPIMVSYS